MKKNGYVECKKPGKCLFKIRVLSLTILLVLLTQSVQSSVIINEVNIGNDDYFELFNYSTTDISLAGYSALIRDENGGDNFDLDLSGIFLSANSGVTIVAEDPQGGEFDAGQNISWIYSRNLSLSILDNSNSVVDFWAHGSTLFGAEAGVTFSPTPLSLLTDNTNLITYQRIDVTTSGLNFYASDWSIDVASRGQENINQVIAPEPATMLLVGLGGMILRKRK